MRTQVPEVFKRLLDADWRKGCYGQAMPWNAATRRFWEILAAGILAGTLLIHCISRPEASGGGARPLVLTEIDLGRAVTVKREGPAFSLRAGPRKGAGTEQVCAVDVPPGFASRARTYAMAGEVRCWMPREGRGGLQAVSRFPGERVPVVSRGLGRERRELLLLGGASGWRRFVVPFSLAGSGDGPSKLELHVTLPDGAAIEIRKLTLVDGWGDFPGAWVSQARNDRLGAVAGTLMGLWGTLLGISRGLWKERSSGALLASGFLWMTGGAICLLILGWACLAGQPWWVRQQLACCGVLLLLAGAGFWGWGRASVLAIR